MSFDKYKKADPLDLPAIARTFHANRDEKKAYYVWVKGEETPAWGRPHADNDDSTGTFAFDRNGDTADRLDIPYADVTKIEDAPEGGASFHVVDLAPGRGRGR